MPTPARAPAPPPGLAPLVEGLGLRWRPGRAPGQAGELNGVVRGHRVLVRLHRRAAYVEQRFKVAGLRLGIARPKGAPPAGAFRTGDAAFDNAWPLRAGSPAVQAALSAPGTEAAAFRAGALAFLRRWSGPAARVDWDAAQLAVHLRPPGGALRRLAALAGARRSAPGPDAATLAALVEDMVSLVEALESSLHVHARQHVGTRPGP